LNEAENLNHEQFGEDRMVAKAEQEIEEANGEGLKPKVVVNEMIKAVAEFVGEAEQSDDLTMLAISYLKE
jgi:sigma-B regulation protein RsbU (phosphoserine phosphatase)